MAKHKTTSLIDKLFETVEKIGRKNALELLDHGQTRYHELTRAKIDFIINNACQYFDIKRVELLNTRTKNTRTEALAMCYYLIMNKVKLNPTQISIYFDKHIAQISRGIKRIRTLDVAHPFERKLKEQLISLQDSYEKEFVD